jgi:hypothetical protein
VKRWNFRVTALLMKGRDRHGLIAGHMKAASRLRWLRDGRNDAMTRRSGSVRNAPVRAMEGRAVASTGK